MNFTAREDYGLRAILDMALHTYGHPIQSKDIAARQGIPEQFLEQLLGALRRGGLVRSVRGASGGYLLARSPAAITMADVLNVLSGPLVPIVCVEQGNLDLCEHAESYGVHVFWQRIAKAIHGVADRLTLQDLLDIQLSADAHAGFMMNI